MRFRTVSEMYRIGEQLMKALVHKSCRESGDFTSFIKATACV